MENLVLRGSVYWIDWTNPSGKRIRRSTKTSDKKWAKQELARVQAEEWDKHINGSPKVCDMTLQQGFDSTMKQVWSKQKSYETPQYNFDRLTRYLSPTTKLAELSRAIFWQVIEEMREEYPDSTINRSFSVVSKILTMARDEWEVIEYTPKVPRLEESEGRRRWLQEGEEEIITGWFRDKEDFDMADLIENLLDTGCRLSELLKLKSTEIALKDSQIHLLDTKNGEYAIQPLNERSLQILRRRYKIGGSPYEGLTRHAAIHRFQTMRKHCFPNDDELCLHSMRHTTASRLVNLGTPIKDVQDFMRHKDIKTTLRYAKLDQSKRAKTAARLNRAAA